MVLPASHGVSRVPWYSGAHLADSYFAYGAFTLFGCTFQCYSAIFVRSILWVRNPGCPKTSGLASSHFARRYFGNHFCFPFLRLLRCFSSPGSLHMTIYSSYGDSALPLPGFPIRISAVLRSLAAPRSFSQLTTSFFGCWCLGIRPMLFSCLIYCFSSAFYCLSIVLC